MFFYNRKLSLYGFIPIGRILHIMHKPHIAQVDRLLSVLKRKRFVGLDKVFPISYWYSIVVDFKQPYKCLSIT